MGVEVVCEIISWEGILYLQVPSEVLGMLRLIDGSVAVASHDDDERYGLIFNDLWRRHEVERREQAKDGK